jgi:hypothetical protein
MTSFYTKFEELSSCELDDEVMIAKNISEGAYFYSNARKLIDILELLTASDVTYKIVHGFRGKHAFEKCNEFRTCTIKLKSDSDTEEAETILRKQSCMYKIKKNLIKIQVKD